jgi:hypothetical protein
MKERRQAPRYTSDLTALVSVPGKDAVLVKVITLAVRGCALTGIGIPDVGRNCELSIQWQGNTIHLGAQVAWKTPQALAGLKFVSVSDQDLALVRQLCSTLRLQPLIPGMTED